MSLPGVPISPGEAHGRLRGVYPGPLPRLENAILAVPGASWPLEAVPPPGVRGVIVVGSPARAVPCEGLPTVGGFDRDLLREGEAVRIDGRAGTLTIEGLRESHVVTAFLERADGHILLLLRSERVGTFRGRWAGISGYLEDPTPLAQAQREVFEETGISSDRLEVAAEGSPVLVREGSTVFVVHPFRFRASGSEVQLDWEHVKAEWVDPAEIGRRATVPKLDQAWRAVRDPAAPKP